MPERKLPHKYFNTIRFCKHKQEIQHNIRKHI